MINYELWLDESGNFEDDASRNNPYLEGSLVGGVLIKKEFVDRQKLEEILDRPIHACELSNEKYREIVLPKLRAIKELGGNLIIFHNKNKEKILSSDTTYINVFAEGIIKLLKKLRVPKERINLDIYYATRKAMDLKFGIIQNKEYVNKIIEKLELLRINEGISRNEFKYKFTPVRANDNNIDKSRPIEFLNSIKVNLSDLVCNAYLTRNSLKFTDVDREEIEKKLYNNEHIFEVLSVYEDNIIERLLIDRNYAEAISQYIFMDKKIRKRNVEKIIEALLSVEENILSYNFDVLVKKITIIIKNYRDNLRNLEVLKILENEIISRLDEENPVINKLRLAIKILILEVANHLGDNREEDRTLEESKKIVKKIGFIEENREIIIKLLNRTAVAKINSFDFDSAINITDTLINEMKILIDFLAECEEKILGEGSEVSKKSDSLAKLYGTNVQANIFKISHENDEYYKKAIENSNNSIDLFLTDPDKNRQKEYRSNIECEVQNYEAAINYLSESLGLNNATIQEIIKAIEGKERNQFSVYHYLRILGKAALNNDKIAKELYEEWDKSNIKEEYSLDIIKKKKIKDPYPINLCLAKLGQYYFYNGNKEDGINYMDEAIRLSDINKVSYTNKGIGIYLMIVKLAMLLQDYDDKIDFKTINTEKDNLINKLNIFLNETKDLVINNHFKELKNQVDVINSEKDINLQYQKYLKIANKLAY